jgi:protein-serine/threonine kinase
MLKRIDVWPRTCGRGPYFIHQPVPCSDQYLFLPRTHLMLSTPTYKLAFDDYEPDWSPVQTQPPKLYRSSSTRSWGVTSIGRGFDWDEEKNDTVNLNEAAPTGRLHNRYKPSDARKQPPFPSPSPIITLSPKQMAFPFPVADSRSQPHSRAASPTSARSLRSGAASPVVPASPRPRRRSSQQRVSLIAGRVSIAPVEPPSPPPLLPQSLRRTPSSGSVLSTAASTRAPSPSSDFQSYLGGRSITEFEIEGEVGRGAYGLVKRGREIMADGSLGVSPPIASRIRDIRLDVLI